MRTSALFFLVGLFMCTQLQAQVKIGDNPQNIDPAAVLELESSTMALIITRVTTAQMEAIVASQGALVYNTETACVHYYNGAEWVNLCSGANVNITADPIVNQLDNSSDISTVVLTQTDEGTNIEVATESITGNQILDGSIFGEDFNDNSITGNKLANNAVTKIKISENAVGPFAIDRDSLPLSFFINDVPYLTAGDITTVSVDADNSITQGGDGGAFFNAAPLFDAIANDLDGDPGNELQGLSRSGNDLILTQPDGNNNIVSLQDLVGMDSGIISQFAVVGQNLVLTEDGNDFPVPLLDLAAAGSTTDELQDLNFDGTSNILTISTPATVGNEVDLSALAGGNADGSETVIMDSPTVTVAGTGTILDPYLLTSAGGADGSETEIADSPTVTVAGTGTALDPYLLTSTGGADGSETEIADSPTVTVAGTGTALDPYLLTSTGGADGSETEIADSPTVTVAGTGTALDPYLLTSTGGADGSETVIDPTASTVGVTGTGTTLDPYILTVTAADGAETVIDPTASTVGVTGTGTTLDPYILTAIESDGSETVIDPTASTVGVTGTGTTLDPYILTVTAADGAETVIDPGASTVGVAGTGTTLDPYVLTGIESDGSETIITTSTTLTVSGSGTTLDSYLIEITDGAVEGGAGGLIADNTITASDLGPNSVDASEIRSDAVGASEIRDDAVRTNEILNETIINEDISPSAAIDGSKIVPNFTAQITTTAGLVVQNDILLNGNNIVPDYVFQKYYLGNSILNENYDFLSLEEIESFVKKYNHLPGIKSAEQVKKEGAWNLSVSNLKNLEKIEELFLHTIDQEKKINKLKSQNNDLIEEVDSLRKDIEQIKSMLRDK